MPRKASPKEAADVDVYGSLRIDRWERNLMALQ